MTPTTKLTRKLAAVLFSDMEGYSRQMGVDEAGTLERLKVHNAIFHGLVTEHGGRVIKTVGDAFMVEFPSAFVGVNCALDIQRALKAHNDANLAKPINVRMGLHAGDVVVEENDLFGETVNLAARLEPKSPVGGVCVTRAVLEQVARKVQARRVDLGVQTLKNIVPALELFALLPADVPLELPPAATAARPRRSARPWVALGLTLVVLGAGAAVMLRRPPARVVSSRSGGVLRAGFPMEPATVIDLMSRRFTLHKFALEMSVEHLLSISKDGAVVPGVVEKLAMDADGLRYQLSLRRGVFFHDSPCFADGHGREARPDDLAWSLTEFLRAGGIDLAAATQPDGRPAVSVDPSGVVSLRLSRPNVFADAELAKVRLLPVELAGCEDLRHLKHVVGTGPFKFETGATNSTLTLTRFDRYWEKDEAGATLPYLDRIELSQVGNALSGVSLLSARSLDVVGFLGGAAVDVIDGLDEGLPAMKPRFAGIEADIGVLSGDGQSSLLCLFGNNRNLGPLSNVEVRQAVFLGIDRAAIAKALGWGIRPMARFLEPYVLGRDPSIPDEVHDLARARELIVAAARLDPKVLEPLEVGVLKDFRAAGDTLRDQLESLGLKVHVAELDRAGMTAAEAEKRIHVTLDLFLAVLRGNEPQQLLAFFNSRLAFGVNHNEELAALVLRAAEERDPAKRVRIYPEIERALLADAVTVPIGYRANSFPPSLMLMGHQIRNLRDPITGRLLQQTVMPDFKRVYLAREPAAPR